MKPGLSDLHRHLDGSIRPSTLRALANAAGTQVPNDLCFTPGMGLQEALSRFAFTLSLIQAPRTVARIASEICEDARAEGVTTLEIRFAPQLHTAAEIPMVVDAALEGIAGRAGLILCGLYGEPPALIEALVDAGATRDGVVGIDLAGGPSPDHQWHMADYAEVFGRAAALGLGRTVHAGEGRPADEIRLAIEVLGAQRIGHGLSVLDDPGLVQLVRDRAVTIEACPTSNWQVGLIPSVADHPLPAWLDQGIRVCINTDNTLLSDVDAPEEYRRALAIPGMNIEKLNQAKLFGIESSFSA